MALFQIAASVALFHLPGLEVEADKWLSNQGKCPEVLPLASQWLCRSLRGLFVAMLFPEFLGVEYNDRIVASTFFGLAISIHSAGSSRRILMDLNLFKTAHRVIDNCRSDALSIVLGSGLFFQLFSPFQISGSGGLGVALR